MQPGFWHERWANSQIGFHESQVNPLLVEHFDALAVPKGARVFLPLCGMTRDIDWLLSRGYRVAGAELSPLAVTRLFERLGVAPTVLRGHELEQHSAAGLDVFVGDFFSLSTGALDGVDAVYDRAALIALPPDMRRRYAMHLDAITNNVPKLLITLEYDQQQVEGPPFCVSGEEVRSLHQDRTSALLARHDVSGGLKGKCPATESVWLVS